MGQLPLLTGVLLALWWAASVAGPPQVAFVGLEGGQVWPGRPIRVQVVWPDTSPPLVGTVRNLSRGDQVNVSFNPLDSLFTAELPYGSGWALDTRVREDSTLQASFGDALEAALGGAADTVRVVFELASLAVAPETVRVDSVLRLRLRDADHMGDPSRQDTLLLSWTSGGGERRGAVALVEAEQGVFTGLVPVRYAGAQDLAAQCIPVAGADSVRFSLYDSLAVAQGWGPVEGAAVDWVIPVRTTTASLTVTHPLFGQVAFLPPTDVRLDVVARDPDVAGSGTVNAFVAKPPGTTPVPIPLHETDRGVFTSRVDPPGLGLTLGPSDTLLVQYPDAADSTGATRVLATSVEVAGRYVAGPVWDARWTGPGCVVLADTVVIPAGHTLVVEGPLTVAALPSRGVLWRVQGTVHLTQGLVRSAALVPHRGDWQGIEVRGSLRAEGSVLSHAVRAVQVMAEGNATLRAVTIADCGDEEASVCQWRGARSWPRVLEGMVQRGALPPAGVVSAGVCSLSQGQVRENGGFGVAITGGTCVLEGVVVADNELDGVFSVGATWSGQGVILEGNAQGGVYAVGGGLSLTASSMTGNGQQGAYCVGGSPTFSACAVVGNGTGGLLVRDGCQLLVQGCLVTSNHFFGLNGAWGCGITVESSAVVGNGGSNVEVNYGTALRCRSSSLAPARRCGVWVGQWCLTDTVDVRECWWGSAPPPLDSTETNCTLIWDGLDSPGRSVARFVPWLLQPPPPPAPTELFAEGDAFMTMAGASGPGDTLLVRLIPLGPTSAVYASLVVASPVDTLHCVGLRTTEGYAVSVALVPSPDLTAPDRLSARVGDRVTAWWAADPSVRVEAVLDVGERPRPTHMRVHVWPNPFGRHLAVRWHPPGRARVGLYGVDGRLRWEASCDQGQEGVAVPGGVVSALPAGSYVVVVETPAGRRCLRAVKVGE